MATSRPLQEIGSSSQRRNSPSYNQATRKMIVSRESSPYTENAPPSSPFPTSPNNTINLTVKRMSPFRFTTSKSNSNNDENNTPEQSPSPSISPKRRTSIERLKQASRVKNSNIFALESKDAYDPNIMPVVERPAANRPLSQQFANNSFTRFDSLKKENNPVGGQQRPQGHKRSETEIFLPTTVMGEEKTRNVALPVSPEKGRQQGSPSPTKSALRTSMFGGGSFDPDAGTWSDTEERVPTPRGGILHRQNKSVTFHADPPVINEYEQQTPEPSVSVEGDHDREGSREGSWESSDSFEQQGDYSFERYSSLEQQQVDMEMGGREGSGSISDAELEKADVVLPEDWTRMSPDAARTQLVNEEDDVFDASPSPSPAHRRSQSVASDGEARPLPPLPAFIRNFLHPKTPAVQEPQRTVQEDAGDSHGVPEELTVTNLDTGEKLDVQVRVAEAGISGSEEDESLVGDLSEFASAPPRISRESILRKVRGTKYDFEDEDSEGEEEGAEVTRPTYRELAELGPDVPIQSRENSRETSWNHLGRYSGAEEATGHNHSDGYGAPAATFEQEEVVVKDEPLEDDEQIDMNAIPEAVPEAEGMAYLPPRSPTRMDDYERQSSVLHHRLSSEESGGQVEEEDDDASRYSSMEPEAESTMLHNGPTEQEVEGKESLMDAMGLLSVKDYSLPAASPAETSYAQEYAFPATAAISPAAKTMPPSRKSFVGLPSYLGSGEYDFGMGAFGAPLAETSAERKLDLEAKPVLQSTREMWQPALESLPLQPAPRAEDVDPFAQAEYVDPASLVSPPGSPDSVIQHRTSDVSSMYDDVVDDGFELQPEPQPEPEPEVVIPERRATIKTGGKLKARPSVSRADLDAMGQQRQIGSEEPMPEMPIQYRDAETGTDDEDQESQTSTEKADSLVDEKATHRRQSRKMLNLNIPQGTAADLSLGLESEFDKVIESQKVCLPFLPAPLFARFDAELHSSHNHASVDADMPSPFQPHTACAGADIHSPRSQKGYLMRQNTKVVVASNRNFSGDSNGTNVSADSNATAKPAMRGTRSANSSPRKPSAEQFLKIEPWNGTSRRKSVRQASSQRSGPAPPLPGQESVALSSVDEDACGSLEDEVPEGTERGRLFVKVVGVKELELPLPRNDRVNFQLTLDNGLHCVTTADLELGKQAPIGQEFELVVQEDLEFQLTLSTKLPPAPVRREVPTPTPSSPTKSVKSSKSGGFAARFLSSPRKRAEKERVEREAQEAEERRARDEAARKRASVVPTAWDLMHELVNAADGSFARAYVNLKAHEGECFGRMVTVDVPCYNEWALERDVNVVHSVRSKRGDRQGPVRRPPYVIGKLEVQLLYVPKPRGMGEEAMPKSMGGAMREMARATAEAGDGVVKEVVREGCLSQQGGDCTHWRRRFFRLQGSRLTAYHEHTHQKRAVVNLAKASRLVDDKSSLVANPTSSSPAKGGRRKSAFAEEDEGYQYVEEGFRIRFANGETIDFYADSAAEKDEWMKALSQVIGKPAVEAKKVEQRWTDLVLARERGTTASSGSEHGSSSPIKSGGTDIKDFTRPPPPPAMQRQQSERKALPARSAPTSPMKGYAPPPRARTPPMASRSGGRSRDAVKSMIF
ncbi:Bud site selection protein bud4 [Elasticomyces elasticus]|nr:Bud site selection protein bud4 [Elasticomyces elasticus]KAK3657724.1 Bud site selection protein bud4 [Elasticomyces elasticus]KAK4922529.1 Bud site selection protein bud4 [Elasticomyces elasticus]KAK5760616.1 Bud site selection protein bud4 [Elasticomyces elasticus]